MQEVNKLTGAERELEEALSRLQPASVRIDRDRLMFEAGRRSMRWSLYAWRGVAAVLVVGVGLSLVTRWGPPAPGRSRPSDVEWVTERATQGAGAMAGLAEGRSRGYLKLRDRVLSEGLDASLGMSSTGHSEAQPSPTVNDLPVDNPLLWRSRGRL